MKAVESSSRGASESEFREFKSGGARFMPFDTLMARITPCLENGKIARYIPSEGVDGPAFGSTEFIVIRGREGITDNDYAYYLTKWEEFRQFAISQMTGSSGRQRVPADSLAKFLAPVPESLSEQRAIAHILGTLDDKIELNRKMNETLEAMAQALFKSWFIDFDPVVVNALRAGNPVPEKFAQRAAHYRDNPERLSLPADTLRQFPDRFQDSELGPIPEGWNLSTIGAEFDLTMGQSPPGTTYNENGNGMPFFQGRRDFGFRYPSLRVYCTSPTRIANEDDTLVSVRAPVGDINMAYETCCIGRGVAAVRHKSGSRSYTYYAMQFLRERFKRFEAEGTVFGSINKKQFQSLSSMKVTPDIITIFENLAYPIDENIRTNEDEMQTLAKLRDTLLPKLISGELRVPDAEKLLEDAL
ncbi:restriction endonuclease subunit S [Methylomarinovum caldicuralii]|nr:restriction endonuclease subunit S [Methylomarinovum caldicuralii]